MALFKSGISPLMEAILEDYELTKIFRIYSSAPSEIQNKFLFNQTKNGDAEIYFNDVQVKDVSTLKKLMSPFEQFA